MSNPVHRVVQCPLYFFRLFRGRRGGFDGYAADAIFDFFDEKIDTDQVVKRIEKTIMIQRCLSRIKEIYDNETGW